MHPVQIENYEPGEIASPFGGTVHHLFGAIDPVASLLEWAGERRVIPISPDDEPYFSPVGSVITSLNVLQKHVETKGYAGLAYLKNTAPRDSSAIVKIFRPLRGRNGITKCSKFFRI